MLKRRIELRYEQAEAETDTAAGTETAGVNAGFLLLYSGNKFHKRLRFALEFPVLYPSFGGHHVLPGPRAEDRRWRYNVFPMQPALQPN